MSIIAPVAEAAGDFLFLAIYGHSLCAEPSLNRYDVQAFWAVFLAQNKL